jgi:broad specificity phosphatase PhoE
LHRFPAFCPLFSAATGNHRKLMAGKRAASAMTASNMFMSHDQHAEIWLIRHGQSESNANLKTRDPQSSSLTEQGRQEARSVSRCISQPPDLIIVSPYCRSILSALPLREKFPGAPVEQWPVQEFTYLPLELYQGSTAIERIPHIETYWQRNEPDLCHAGAESFAQFLARVKTIMERLQGLAGFTVLFGHGHTIRLLWQLLSCGMEATPARQMQMYNHLRQAVAIPNCAIMKLRFTPRTGLWMSGFLDAVRSEHGTTGAVPGLTLFSFHS